MSTDNRSRVDPFTLEDEDNESQEGDLTTPGGGASHIDQDGTTTQTSAAKSDYPSLKSEIVVQPPPADQ
jgi:hypothetical protein